jgi:glycosyltransferase involved in cell wall biosynthesis
MKTVVIIPAYNAEKTIAQVVNISKHHCNEVIVVDDCSSDNTPKIIQGLGIKYALCGKNHGQGSATRIGMKMALEFGADIIITLDCDGQHNPNEIPRLLKPILKSRVDMVIGARFINEYKMPRYRKFGINVINWLYNVCNREKLIDTQSCFRAYTRQLVEKLTIEEDGFGFSTEVLIKARKMKVRMVEVPISCIYHNLEQDSSMNPLKHGLMVAWKTIWWRIKLWA